MPLIPLLLQTFDLEFAMTRRLLEHVPEHLAAWQPHPKSMPLGQLAMHVATLPALAILCLSTESFSLNGGAGTDHAFSTQRHLLDTFDDHAARLRHALSTATDGDIDRHWSLSLGERTLFDQPRGLVLLHNCLGHLSHHRAQLGLYLRLNDLPVPPVYGPTADHPAPH